MEELSQEYILSLIFRSLLNREELLLKKYEAYYKATQNSEIKSMLKDFRKISREHIDQLKDKMIKLKIYG